MIKKKIIFILPFLALLMLSACGEDRTQEYEAFTQHNRWMFEVMSDKYLWSSKFSEQTWKDYFAKPEKYFSKLIGKGDKDNGSYIVVDSLHLDSHPRGHYNHLDSYGLDFALVKDPTSATTRTYARVITVYPNSPASKAGLIRNDYIESSDGYKISSSTSYMLENGPSHNLVVKRMLADDAGICYWNGERETTLGASTQVEDAPYLYHVFSEQKGKVIGYLMCNHLNPGLSTSRDADTRYRDQLAQIFQIFKSQKVQELVLDLRLCNYGTLDMARTLASYIVPASCKDKAFATTFWNSKYSASNQTITFDAQLSQQSLGLSRIFIITSGMTQGAPEWVINSLCYALGKENVTCIGGRTAGQEFMTEHAGDYGNQIHIYPAVAYVGNGDGDYESYTNGFAPDIEFEEFGEYLYDYGDTYETLLRIALDRINTHN